MSEIKVISIDMFQTLVNVNSRIPVIWSKKILLDEYKEEVAYQYGSTLQKIFLEHFHDKYQQEKFDTITNMFRHCFELVFERFEIDISPKEAADIITHKHGFSIPYPDTELFFQLAKGFPLCLVSDADYVMVNPLIEKYQFDQVFISEELRTYKGSPGAVIFKKVLEYYQVEAEEIIHIGDSYADVYGAKQVGMQACWLNRNSSNWEREVKPDFIIKSLDEIREII